MSDIRITITLETTHDEPEWLKDQLSEAVEDILMVNDIVQHKYTAEVKSL